jgi:serine/threonine-protein kinase
VGSGLREDCEMSDWTVPGYAEVRELGEGSGGRVVLAVHEVTGTPVAVKYLGEELRTDSDFVLEFRGEAQLLGDLRSPYVTGLYEYVESPDGAAIVMELVDGIALRALLRQEGATGPEAALAVLKGSLLGLAAAHRAGVVHRDYKPENVLVAADGASKLVDFGIAVRSGATSSGITGTPPYMAPEQWNGGAASPATDVYAATATFFECLTGEKPYTGDNFAELALRHVTAPIPAERAPEEVRPLILRGLAKDPADRPADAAAFVAELEEIAGAAYGEDWEERGQRKLAALAALLPLLFPSAGGGPGAGNTALATTVLGGGAGFGRLAGRRGLLIGAGVLVLAGALTFTAVATGGGSGHTTTETVAMTTLSPTASPSASTTDSGSSSPTASAAVTDSATPTPTAAETSAAPPSASGPPSATPSTSASASASTSTAPAVKVTSLSMTALQQTGTASASASVTVGTDGTGPVTLTVTWYVSDTKGTLGTQDGSPQTYTLSGSTQYTVSPAPTHTYTGAGCYWGAMATTSPAAAGGGSSQQIVTRQCGIR